MKESHHLKNVEDINTEDIVDKDEVKFLTEQLKLMKEKNVHLEISLENQKLKNQELQQEIQHVRTTSDKKVNMLQDDLSQKTKQVNLLKKKMVFQDREHQECKKENLKIKTLQYALSGKNIEVNLLKEQMDIQVKVHQSCKIELNETKNQLYYKHLALDGVIKSNIKLQEELACVAACDQQKNSACKTAVSRIMQNNVDDVFKSSNDVSQEVKEENSTEKQTAVSRQAIVDATPSSKNANFDKKSIVTVMAGASRTQIVAVNKIQKKRRRRNKKRFD